jgi:hypothetical protein
MRAVQTKSYATGESLAGTDWPQHGDPVSVWEWSERQDSNLRHPAPKAGALARLSYAPTRPRDGSLQIRGGLQSEIGPAP